MLPPTFVEPPATIHLKFEISDPDGLHQATLYAHTGIGLVECKQLSGYSSTVEFITNEFYIGRDNIDARLLVMDEHGNFKNHNFRIDIINLLPPSEVVSIPDSNLAAAIRATLRLAPHSNITQLNMFGLRKLNADKKGIKNLTGLEYAHNLKELWLKDNAISDISPLSKLKKLTSLGLDGNTISDVSSLSGVTELRILGLGINAISDISPLSKLKKLTFLNLNHNTISDVSLLAELTQLKDLSASDNKISDITPLTALTQLQDLSLSRNNISDIRPLARLTQLWDLYLRSNQINDITPFTGLANIRRLHLQFNEIKDASPFIGLANLAELHLEGNPIKNRKPLFELLAKNPDVRIYLKRGGEPLPVTLSHFRAELTDTGVTLKWITESEVDNAGFYIYRSETRDGQFKVLNPIMIQGAGTTSERNTYTWTDTTAKPNVAYYYRIEDISHAGVREQLATVRMRGLVSASGKLTTRWADLKTAE